MANRLERTTRTTARGLAYGVSGVLASCGLIAACGLDYPSAPATLASGNAGAPGAAGAGVAGAGAAGAPGRAGAGGSGAPSTPDAGAGSGGSASTGAGGASGSSGSAGSPSTGGTGGTPVAANPCDAIKADSRTILQTNCAGCHEAPNKQGNFDFVLETAQLKTAGLLVPGSPETSRLYNRVAAGEMPPAGQTQRPSNGDVTTLYQWIKVCTVAALATDAGTGGTPSPEAGGGGGGTAAAPFIDNVTISRWMASDITTIRIQDQPFQRYLSLAHLLNAGATSADMDLYRYAQAKAINALSLGTRIVTPRAIDQYQTVFRIDLRDLEWDASNGADKWELLVAANPYAIEYVDDAATVVKSLTKTKVPVQTGNWLVFGGTQPPLYNDLVGIPTTLDALQRTLGTNINQDIAQEEVWRSGFNDSGIAQLNRVLERHEIPAGGNRSLWISYDFAGNGGRENIFSNPLDFQSDASEVIFSLPNGMHGYMLVDGVGNRLDVGNDAVVVDRTQKNGNVINGISCIGCHDGGIKFKKDEVRDFVDSSFNFDATTKDTVDAIYSLPADFQTVVTQDSNLFLQEVQRLSPPPTVTTEPVSAVFHRFEADVNLTSAAAELGVTREQLLTQLGRLDPALAPLATGTVKRDVFKAAFAQTVCLLKVGLANNAACR